MSTKQRVVRTLHRTFRPFGAPGDPMIKTVTRVLVVRDRETGNDSAITYDVPQVDSYADLINILDEYTLTRLANDFLNQRARERAKYDHEHRSK